jgi:TolA-binding protein
MKSHHSARSLLTAAALLAAITSLPACLQTRSAQKEQEEKQVFKKQLTNLQQNTADINTRFQDLEDEARRVNGRVEVLESKVNQMSAKADKGDQGLENKMRELNEVYKEEFNKMGADITALKQQIAMMQEDQKRVREESESKAQAQAAAKATEQAKGPFASAESKFDKKNWKDAILDYEKYRSQNPKGKQVPVATYKIGVAFQELGMADDAKLFYDEVIAKFPKSKEAEKAVSRLKGMKKK